MITVVTSLYDIDRENLDGRSWDSYLEWFKKNIGYKQSDGCFR